MRTGTRQVTPRIIRPELIEEGDIIQVQFPDDGGITVTKTGIVAYIERHAGMSHFLTQQGSVIARYPVGGKYKEKFFLIARMPVQNEMFDMFKERVK